MTFNPGTQLNGPGGVRYRVLADDLARREVTVEPIAGGLVRTVSYFEISEGHYWPDTDLDLLEA